jgi:membrane-associated phospholipid phosphatase
MSRLLIVIALVCSTTLCAQESESIPFEGRIVYDLNHIDSPGLTSASIAVSDALLPLGVGIPALLYGTSFLLEEGPSQRHAAESGVQMGVTMGVTYATIFVLKAAVGRDRPYQSFPGLITNRHPDGDPLGSSFPSGHSAGAAALATSLSLCYPHWYVIAPSVGYALWTGFARMNLGVHYLTDVLAGYAVGAGVAYGIHLLRNELFDAAEPFLPGQPGVPSIGRIGVGMNGSTPLVAVSFSF